MMKKIMIGTVAFVMSLPMIALATGGRDDDKEEVRGTRPTVLVTNTVKNTNNVGVRNDNRNNNTNRNRNSNTNIASGGAGGNGGSATVGNINVGGASVGNVSGGNATGGSATVGDVSNDQFQTQRQEQNQTQTANSNQTQSANNEGNSQNLSVTSYNPRAVPAAFAPDVYPTAPCRVGGSFGGSLVGGAVSIGGSRQDKECDKRELSRSFASIGQYEAAQRILCATESAKEVFGSVEECMKTIATGPKTDSSSVQVTVNPQGISTEELAARDKKMIEVLNRK